MESRFLKTLILSAVYISIHYLLSLVNLLWIEKFVSIPLIVLTLYSGLDPVFSLVFGIVSITLGTFSTWNAWPPGSENPQMWSVFLRGSLVGVAGIFSKRWILLAPIMPALFWFITGERFLVFVINYLLTVAAILALKKRKEG